MLRCSNVVPIAIVSSRISACQGFRNNAGTTTIRSGELVWMGPIQSWPRRGFIHGWLPATSLSWVSHGFSSSIPATSASSVELQGGFTATIVAALGLLSLSGALLAGVISGIGNPGGEAFRIEFGISGGRSGGSRWRLHPRPRHLIRYRGGGAAHGRAGP